MSDRPFCGVIGSIPVYAHFHAYLDFAWSLARRIMSEIALGHAAEDHLATERGPKRQIAIAHR